MIKKVLCFIQSDGWANTFRFIFKPIIARFRKESKTVILCATSRPENITWRKEWSCYRIEVLTDVSEVAMLDFPRLKYHPCRKWLSEGAVLHLLYDGDIPVAFGWTHFADHHIDHVGTFDISSGETAYLGPQFVHKNHRGRGLQKLIVFKEMSDAPANINHFITCINSHNIASLKSNVSVGFKEAGSCTYNIKMKDIQLVINEDAREYIKIK